MPAVAVLGDSLSKEGYGIRVVEQTWPMIMKASLSFDADVSIHAKGGLLASCSADVRANAFGCSNCFATAVHEEADWYIFCLGTNDMIRGIGSEGLETGLDRLMLQIKAAVKSTAGKGVRYFLVQPPNICRNKKAEKRRQETLIPCLEKLASKHNATVIQSPPMKPSHKHQDGVHLSASGARLLGEAVAMKLNSVGRFRKKLKQIHVEMSPRQVATANAAAQRLGKKAFLSMTREKLRSWAARYKVPYTGGKKDDEFLNVVSKLDLRWQLFV